MTLRAVIWCAVSSQAQAADDKISLEEQERAARQFADVQGYNVVATLTIPGHSRWESDPITALEEFARDGIFAYQELRQMWQQRAFDVLICYTHSRLARSFTMQSWVIENVIRSGARVYRLQGGWIDPVDYLPQIAMGGMSTAGEVDRLRKAHNVGMTERARRGLPTSSNTVWSHKVIRDEKGRAVKTAVDESKRRLLNDLATLLLEGVGWNSIERDLYERFGHVDPRTGKPFSRLSMYRSVHNPVFWGNSARFWRDAFGPNTQKTDMWVFDEHEPAPPPTLVFYGTHEASYTGELGERVKAELRRRRSSIRGTARPHRTRRFSGLLVCARCGYFMGYHGNAQRWTGMGCVSHYIKELPARAACTQRKMISEKQIQAYIDGLLRRMIEVDSVELLYDVPLDEDDLDRKIESLQADIASAEDQARRLIHKQSSAPDNLQNLYDEQINTLGERLKSLRADLLRTQQEVISADTVKQTVTLEEIAELSLPAFWALSDVEVNQMLHRLMGKRRFVVDEAQFVGITDAPRPQPG